MSWPTGTIPAHITQLRTQIQLCTASWVAAGGLLAQIHFAFCNVSGVKGTADLLPAMMIQEATVKRRFFAEGAKPVVGGIFTLVLYVDLSAYPFAANLEALAQAFLDELTAQETGIIFQDDCEVGDASDPSPAMVEADTGTTVTNFRSIKLTIPWGISP